MGNEVIKDSLNNIYIKLEEEKVSMNISLTKKAEIRTSAFVC